MSNQPYTIQYESLENINYSSRDAMEKYIKSEAEVWGSFLETLRQQTQYPNIPFRNGNTHVSILAGAFSTLLAKLDNISEFNQLSQGYRGIAIPPPSTTVEGQLILGLHENGRLDDATSAFFWFIANDSRQSRRSNQNIQGFINEGKKLIEAGHVTAALPFRKVTSQKLAGSVRSAEFQVAAFNKEIQRSQTINNNHKTLLTNFRDNLKRRSKRIQDVVFNRERNRQTNYEEWIGLIEKQVDERFKSADKRLEALDKANKIKQEARQKEFDRLLELFHDKLRIQAPVALWEKRAAQHKQKSQIAFICFGILSVLAIGAAVSIPIFAGDNIAASFHTEFCSGKSSDCIRVFSAKGPLTIAGILLVMSLVMWSIRLQYRVFLSERHLALDASEKQAFAETYLAIKEGDGVGSDNEAIVLASLFRPTQDGIIKDDENALDLSAAAILAKQLSR